MGDDVVERLRILQQQDWKQMTVRLLHYAAKRFVAAGIVVEDGAVRGISISDLVQDAIKSVWSSDGEGRNWDPEKVSLSVFLYNAVSGNISNLFDLHEVKKVNAWPDGGEKDAPAEDGMLTHHADPSHDHARYLIRRPQMPEEILIEQEAMEHRHDLLLEAADDDEELIRYLDSLDRGLEKPSDVARAWGVEPQVIYNAENRLRGRVRAIMRRKKGESEPNT